jgi:hypothetical protein
MWALRVSRARAFSFRYTDSWGPRVRLEHRAALRLYHLRVDPPVRVSPSSRRAVATETPRITGIDRWGCCELPDHLPWL